VGDRILSVNGQPVDHAGQVIRRVRLQLDGEPLRFGIERGGRQLPLELNLPARGQPLRAANDNGVAQPPPALSSTPGPS
jgi:S1-C subfamily serine protease